MPEETKPKVFLGSSTEGLDVAKAIQSNLLEEYEVTLWKNDVFAIGETIIEALQNTLKDYDFGIFVFTPDDKVTYREGDYYIARDNVIFELGLFVGKLGFRNTFVVHPKNIKLKFPSDLTGVVTAKFDPSMSKLDTAISGACTRISKAIKKNYEAHYATQKDMSWDELWIYVRNLSLRLRRSPSTFGGFTPDLILGISHGGMVIADLLARDWGRKIPIVSLWDQKGKRSFDNSINKTMLPVIDESQYADILLVNDINRTGQTIANVQEYLKRNLTTDKDIKTAVIVNVQDGDDPITTTKQIKVDYSMVFSVKRYYRMPYALPMQETVFK